MGTQYCGWSPSIPSATRVPCTLYNHVGKLAQAVVADSFIFFILFEIFWEKLLKSHIFYIYLNNAES